MDFGEARVSSAGWSGRRTTWCWTCPTAICFVKAYPAETTEAFLDGSLGFRLSGRRVRQHVAVARILGDVGTRAFTELQSHYLQDRF